MRIAYLLLLITSLISCNQSERQLNYFKTDNFFIIDTSEVANQFLKNGQNSDYAIYYIGPDLDTVKIGRRYWIGRTILHDTLTQSMTRQYSNKTLDIFVDTSIKTNSPTEYISDNLNAVRDSTINYNSFLITIKNISDSTIYLGKTFSLFYVHREALNKKGNWVKIDKSLNETGICGTNEPTILLKPKELVISKIPRYKGDFQTDFRLVFGFENNIVYSNIYRDYIDENSVSKISLDE